MPLLLGNICWVAEHPQSLGHKGSKKAAIKAFVVISAAGSKRGRFLQLSLSVSPASLLHSKHLCRMWSWTWDKHSVLAKMAQLFKHDQILLILYILLKLKLFRATFRRTYSPLDQVICGVWKIIKS